IKTGTDYFYSVFIQFLSQFQSRLTSQLNNYTLWFLMTYDIIYMFPKNRFEIQFICRIKVRRHCLRVTVNHNGFVPALSSSKNTVHTTVIKLYPLSDSIRTGSEYHNFLFLGNDTFILGIAQSILGLHLIRDRRVTIRRRGLKLRCTGTSQLIT